MKIAIPADEKKIDIEVCVSFGRAPYFVIYDSETEEVSYIENTAANAKGGAGIKAAQLIVDSGAKILLTPRCGENAADVIENAEIKIFRTKKGTISENIQNYKNGLLLPLDEVHEGFHGKGSI